MVRHLNSTNYYEKTDTTLCEFYNKYNFHSKLVDSKLDISIMTFKIVKILEE